MRSQTMNLRNSAAHFFRGSIALALVTLAFSWCYVICVDRRRLPAVARQLGDRQDSHNRNRDE
jgi:hypothetical protein